MRSPVGVNIFTSLCSHPVQNVPSSPKMCMAHFTDTCGSMCQNFLLHKAKYCSTCVCACVCVCVCVCVYPSVSLWTLGLVPPLAIVTKATVMGVYYLLSPCFQFVQLHIRVCACWVNLYRYVCDSIRSLRNCIHLPQHTSHFNFPPTAQELQFLHLLLSRDTWSTGGHLSKPA
jgi:hypothetical protein